ncbi:MAG: aldo/keto reductase [Candidatus Magnetominusculus sp. LBB02]|nr:aldo/keto reductase [Candidatus Magnetominusculus sp. LBB02]
MKRRDFLKAGAVTAAASALIGQTAVSHAAQESGPAVKRYTEIGKTGLKMSDISCGCGGLPSASLVLRAIDKGINYFDTAPDYGKSETYIGEAVKGIKRDKIILASKFCNPLPYPAHLPAGTSKDKYIASVDDSLSRLKTDYLDFVFVHAIGEADKDKDKELKRLLDDNMLSAYDALKKAGKVKHLAVSSHGPTNMEDLLMAAVDSGHYDLIMPSFNFMKFPKIPDVLKEAKKKGVGVVAMKTLAGAKDMNMDFKGADFAQSAFKWTLKHPEVNGLIVTMKSVADIDNYLSASGQSYTEADERVLNQYASLHGSSYCRTGCGVCEGACASGVDIAASLRYQMYFKDYGMERRAMESYALLNNKAEACLTCNNTTCTGACPYGLPVADMLRDTHQTLTFNV